MNKIHLSLITLAALATAGAAAYLYLNPALSSEALEGLCCGELSSAAAIEWDFQKEPEPPPAPDSIRVPIFIYHSIRPRYANEPKNQDLYDITPELFERELKYLKDNGYAALSLDDLANYIATGVKPPDKSAILTFDDGWHNQYKYGFSLLKKYGFSGTFFIYTNAIGKKHFLTWDEVLDLNKNSMVIGSHTLSHPYLKTLPIADFRREATLSKKILEEKLGKPVVHFASPFGYSSPEIAAVLKEAGYKTGRTTYKGVYHGKNDLLALRGILTDDSFDDFVKILERVK